MLGATSRQGLLTVRTICAWCTVVIRDVVVLEPHLVSHGICPACAVTLLQQADEVLRLEQVIREQTEQTELNQKQEVIEGENV